MYLRLGNTVIVIKIFNLEEKSSNLHQAFSKMAKESYKIKLNGVRSIAK